VNEGKDYPPHTEERKEGDPAPSLDCSAWELGSFLLIEMLLAVSRGAGPVEQ